MRQGTGGLSSRHVECVMNLAAPCRGFVFWHLQSRVPQCPLALGCCIDAARLRHRLQGVASLRTLGKGWPTRPFPRTSVRQLENSIHASPTGRHCRPTPVRFHGKGRGPFACRGSRVSTCTQIVPIVVCNLTKQRHYVYLPMVQTPTGMSLEPPFPLPVFPVRVDGECQTMCN